MTERKRAAGYVRVSQVGDRGGDSFLSPDVQREKIEAWAAYRDYTITTWYVDLDVSGRTMRRPEFERLMADARARHFDVVAVYRLTRFGRNVRGVAVALDALEKLDIGLVSVTEDIDTTTAGGKFMRNVLFAIAEFESERIGEEWRNVHASRRARGIAHVARPVTGYRASGAVIKAIDETEARAVQTMFEMRARGAGYGEIRAALRSAGHVSRTGRPAFSQSTISGILRNPLYAGLVRLGNGDLIEATHEPIVARALWERVQQTTAHVARDNRHSGALLSGLLVCSSCGYRMHYERGRRREGVERPASYRCAGRQRANGCAHPMYVHAEYAETHVEERFLRRFNARQMPHSGVLKATRQQQEWQRRSGRLHARIDELTRALDELGSQRYVKGTLQRDEYERLSARFLAERVDLEEQLDEVERLTRTAQPIERDVLALWPKYDVVVKRRALRLAIASITVDPAPRKGRGQRDLIAQRLRIGWLQ